MVNKTHTKGIISLIILGPHTLWRHHNRCVFDGTSPCIQEVKPNLKMRLTSGAWLVLKLLGGLGLGLFNDPVCSSGQVNR